MTVYTFCQNAAKDKARHKPLKYFEEEWFCFFSYHHHTRDSCQISWYNTLPRNTRVKWLCLSFMLACVTKWWWTECGDWRHSFIVIFLHFFPFLLLLQRKLLCSDWVHTLLSKSIYLSKSKVSGKSNFYICWKTYT